MRFWLAMLGAALLSACGTQDTPAQQEWPAPSPAIWQVTAPGGETGWLFGTVHALPDGVEWRSAAFETAFAQAGQLVVEIANLDDTQASFDAFRQSAYLSTQGPLEMRVEPGERELLAQFIERVEADAGDFTDMDSWAAALVLAGGVRSGDPANGVDLALIASGKPVLGLESYTQQYAIFDTLPVEEQSDLLMAVAREAAATDPDQALRLWLTGDEEGLQQLAMQGLLADQELRLALMTARNQTWLGQITTLLDTDQKPFVAVGAAHMLGDDGLPAMLLRSGYTVERLP